MYCERLHGGITLIAFVVKDYMGHMFWDQDTWMFPPIALLHIDLGHIIVETRFRTHNAALLYANATGYSGSRYPWESAFTGNNGIMTLIKFDLRGNSFSVIYKTLLLNY